MPTDIDDLKELLASLRKAETEQQALEANERFVEEISKLELENKIPDADFTADMIAFLLAEIAVLNYEIARLKK